MLITFIRDLCISILKFATVVEVGKLMVTGKYVIGNLYMYTGNWPILYNKDCVICCTKGHLPTHYYTLPSGSNVHHDHSYLTFTILSSPLHSVPIPLI